MDTQDGAYPGNQEQVAQLPAPRHPGHEGGCWLALAPEAPPPAAAVAIVAPKAYWLAMPPPAPVLLRDEAPALLEVLVVLPALSGRRAMGGANRGEGGDACRG